MNSLTIPPGTPELSQKKQVRQWIEELTDFTPQQIDLALQKIQQQQAQAS